MTQCPQVQNKSNQGEGATANDESGSKRNPAGQWPRNGDISWRICRAVRSDDGRHSVVEERWQGCGGLSHHLAKPQVATRGSQNGLFRQCRSF